MNGQQPPNFQFATARELYAAYPQIEEDLTAQPDGGAALDFMAALAGTPTPENALTFAAYALEKRPAVWWGHECLARADEVLTANDHEIMALAAAWVGEPNEATRYAALDAALASPAKTPGVWLGLAVGWSGGSMAPRGLPAVPPPMHLTARAVNAAVLSVLARFDRAARPEVLKSFVRMARLLAEGS